MKGAQYRQGDVLLVPVPSIPRRARRTKRGKEALVLAEGELSGHRHAIADAGAELLETGADSFLRVLDETGVSLTHEEHGSILLPRGEYRVVRQREYRQEGLRFVGD